MGIISKYTNPQKELNLNGVYYKIVKIEYTLGEPELLTIIVDCFTSRDTRNKNLQPFDRKVFIADVNQFGEMFNKDKLFSMAYKFIKSYDDLREGQDD